MPTQQYNFHFGTAGGSYEVQDLSPYMESGFGPQASRLLEEYVEQDLYTGELP